MTTHFTRKTEGATRPELSMNQWASFYINNMLPCCLFNFIYIISVACSAPKLRFVTATRLSTKARNDKCILLIEKQHVLVVISAVVD